MAAVPTRGATQSEAGRNERRLRRAAMLAGLVALLPLVVMAALAILADAEWRAAHTIDDALVAYTGFALVFASAARFGQAMRVSGAATAPAIAGLLSLAVALAALFIPERAALGALAVGLAAAGAWDVWSAERGMLPAWYGRLRLMTTAIALPALIAAIVFMPDAA